MRKETEKGPTVPAPIVSNIALLDLMSQKCIVMPPLYSRAKAENTVLMPNVRNSASAWVRAPEVRMAAALSAPHAAPMASPARRAGT